MYKFLILYNFLYNFFLKNKPYLLNIINYKLFTFNNKKYIKFLSKILKSNELIILLKGDAVQISYLGKCSNHQYSNELFFINNNNNIEYFNKKNLMQFSFKETALSGKIKSLININIKNRQSYEVISTIALLQNKFLKSNDKNDLLYFSYKQILKVHNKYYKSSLIESNISTIVNNTYYKDKKGNKIALKTLLPKKHFVIYLRCRYLLNQNYLLSDKQLSECLKNTFNITISKESIFQIRKKYFIPNKRNRQLNMYYNYSSRFTKAYELNNKNIQHFKNKQGVYELITLKKPNNDNKKAIYIGSSKNLQKRLYQYLNYLAHTRELNDFLKSQIIYFRIIETETYKELEKDILNAFFIHYGSYPAFNKNRILLF